MQSMMFKHEEWFEGNTRLPIAALTFSTVEDMYQAFRARLIDELTAEGRLSEPLRMGR